MRTLPYWKNWKKTERNFLSAAGRSSIKAFDPCLDTGEVGEGPAVGEVEEPGEVGEGPVVESPIEAVREAAGRVEDFPGPVVSPVPRSSGGSGGIRRPKKLRLYLKKLEK